MSNRFSRYAPGANYSPESFKDMAVVPIALRQRHDAALAEQDNLLLQLNNLDVRDSERDYYNQKKQEITSKVDSLTNKINTIGAGDSNLLGEFRNMKRDYNKEVSLSGGLGQAIDIKKRMDDQKAKFLEFGVKQGFSPETEGKNWDLQYNQYNQKNPNDKIGTDGFAFGETNFTLAPKMVDAMNIHKEGQGLLGKFVNDEAWQSYTPTMNADGTVHYVQTGGKKMNEDNLKNLQAYENFINQKVLNPDSDLRQSLRRSRPGTPESDIVSDFLKESDFLSQAMRIKVDSNMTMQKPIDNGSGKKKDVNEPATLISHSTGKNPLEGKSYADVYNGTDIAKYEQEELSPSGITEEHSAEKKLAILQHDKLKSLVNEDGNKKLINDWLISNGNLTGIKDTKNVLETYQNTISVNEKKIQDLKNSNDYKVLKARDVLISGESTMQEKELAKKVMNTYGYSETKQQQYNDLQSKIFQLNKRNVDSKEAIENAMKSTLKDQVSDLQYSKLYTFGADADGNPGGSNDTQKSLNESLNHIGKDHILDYINNGGGKFTEVDSDEFVDKKESKAFDTLRKDLNSADTDLEFDGIVDLGSTGTSQVMMRYNRKMPDGKKFTGRLLLDYDNKNTDTSLLDNFLTEMQGNLDLKGKAVIQSIKDNKSYKDMSVDSSEFYNKGISPSQTSRVKIHANDLDKSIQNIPEFKEANYINNFKHNQIVLNKDGYHEMYLKNSDDKKEPAGYLSAGMWFQKEFVREHKDMLYSSPDPLKTIDSNASDRSQFITSMKDFAEQYSDPKDGVAQIGGTQMQKQAFLKARQDFINNVNSSKDIKQQNEFAKAFYEEMKGMKIAFKNIKTLL